MLSPEVTRGDSIDLLLTGVVTPEMSGSKLSNRLSTLQPRLKSLYISGFLDLNLVERQLLDVAVPFIQKPFTLEALARKVQEVSTRGREPEDYSVAHSNRVKLTRRRLDRGTTALSVVLANSDLIDGVVVFPSIPLRAPIVRSLNRTFRLLSEPCGASARDPGAPPSTRRSATLRRAAKTDPGGSVLVGLAERSLERLAIRGLHEFTASCSNWTLTSARPA